MLLLAIEIYRGAKTSWVRFPDRIMFTKARHLYSLVNDHSGVHIHTSTQDNFYSRHLELHIHDEKPLNFCLYARSGMISEST